MLKGYIVWLIFILGIECESESPSLCVSKGIGGTSSSQRVSAEPWLAERDGAASWTCGLMPAGEVLDSRDSVEDRPLSAAKLSAKTQVWNFNAFFSFRVKRHATVGAPVV